MVWFIFKVVTKYLKLVILFINLRQNLNQEIKGKYFFSVGDRNKSILGALHLIAYVTGYIKPLVGFSSSDEF